MEDFISNLYNATTVLVLELMRKNLVCRKFEKKLITCFQFSIVEMHSEPCQTYLINIFSKKFHLRC